MNLSKAERIEASNEIVSGAKLDTSYIVINAAATIIACSGLLANSTAVVIGSMLIATLLSPIAAVALSLNQRNRQGVIRNSGTLLFGVILVISIAFFFGLLFPQIEPTDRMFARTEPGIFDFIIAFVGGIAGAVALLFKRYKGIMTGVGIATALVPPLSTTGIFFAKTNYVLGIKALELAAINICFILIGNFLVFKFFKFRSQD